MVTSLTQTKNATTFGLQNAVFCFIISIIRRLCISVLSIHHLFALLSVVVKKRSYIDMI